ncbi:unnamed protein product [Nesidiocoris tenuis]|uniref:C2H2-type domain-containing protein n=1 Tax=Nesidiocoris tenuis TaxID=355587 RepID=A0A6H5HQ69_9HEMI|nr:unnamed protein product [Nesidiocoris tenuis]
MFAKTGLNVVGATIVQSNTPEVQSPSYSEKLVLPIISNVSPPLLKVPGISTPVQFPPLRFPPSMNPLTQITAYNPLTLPTLSPVKSSTQPQGPLASPYNGGVGTIMLAGKEIPFVPGMPGPQTLLGSSPPLAVPSHVQLQKQEKSVIIRSPVPSISHTKTDTPKPPPPPRAPSPVKAESPEPEPAVKQLSDSKDDSKSASEGQERKFLRPSSLPLKPGTYMPKKQLAAPFHTTSLISPETPRPRKSYGQLYLNGHAYTYLGLKCSTRMFFCTLNKPQPIYVPLAPDQYKVSMYSNWTSGPITPAGVDEESEETEEDEDDEDDESEDDAEDGLYTRAALKTPVITSASSQPLLMASVCSTTEKLPSTPIVEHSDDGALLHAYLTERTVRDQHIKVQLNRKRDLEPVERVSDSDSSQLHQPMVSDGLNCNRGIVPGVSTEDGKSMCSVCNKVFNKPSQLRLHVNIHYFERPFRCESCAVSFRTKGHLQKHLRSLSHLNKMNMNSTFGTATTSNPRPFKCDDCKIAFRIHGHLAKHFRSKMHIMKLECLGKLPFGMYAELERSGINMSDIDTTDCENSLESLQPNLVEK